MRFRQESWILVLASGASEALGYLTTTREGHVAGQGGETAFCVFTAPACGWTDLATPRRVGNALYRLWSSPNRESALGERRAPAVLSLANRYAAPPL